MGLPRKVAVLGLDGVPYSLLKHLFASGHMPFMADIAASGTFVPMETALPPISSVAWASFMTGKNPGEHGIFGFTDLQDNEISLSLPSFDDIRVPVIWQSLPGKRSLVVNLPFTYPARPLSGVLISGFVAPIFERSVYPESLIPWLRSKNYRIDVDSVRGRQDRRGLVRDLFETLSVHEEVMLSLMQSEPWDLFIGVITGTDRLHHFFFDAYGDPANPVHADFIQYYQKIDAFVRRFCVTVGSATRLILLSDHGFTDLKWQIYLNHILRTMGYLSFVRPNPQSIADIHPSSRAFAMDPGRIYLNAAARFRNGILPLGSAQEVRAQLKSRLERLRPADVGIYDDTSGEPIFSEVLVKEQVYTGQSVHLAPDLVVIPTRGYDVKATVSVSAAAMKDIFTGMHTHDDAFLMVNDSSIARRLARPHITDVAALIEEGLL
jgi:predicted AlkP superfamily phosphohydrolase/phosphomutase